MICFSQRKMCAKLAQKHNNQHLEDCGASWMLPVDRTTHESGFVSSELFKNRIWNLDPFKLQEQTPMWFCGGFS
jgi:hypothetical protein